MHVIYDARLMVDQYSGLGRFTGELLFALLDINQDPVINYSVIIWEYPDDKVENLYYTRLRDLEKKNICQVLSVPCQPISISQHFGLYRYIKHLKGDIYFYAHFDLPLSVGLPSINVVHDLTVLKLDDYIAKNRWLKTKYFQWMLKLVARKATYTFAVSETTRADLIGEIGRHFSDKIGVCGEGAILEGSSEARVRKPSITTPAQFLLYVGVRRPHKNLKRIIDLFILLKENALYFGDLLIAGSTKSFGFDFDSYIRERSDIQILGKVDDDSLFALYQNMDALVCLSKYEGFGLPVVEAGIYHKKTIISDGGSLPEVAPPWAFVLPNDSDLKEKVFEVGDYLKSRVVMDETYKNKYTWGRSALVVKKMFLEQLSLHTYGKSKL